MNSTIVTDFLQHPPLWAAVLSGLMFVVAAVKLELLLLDWFCDHAEAWWKTWRVRRELRRHLGTAERNEDRIAREIATQLTRMEARDRGRVVPIGAAPPDDARRRQALNALVDLRGKGAVNQ